jgi:hypothetical protein
LRGKPRARGLFCGEKNAYKKITTQYIHRTITITTHKMLRIL